MRFSLSSPPIFAGFYVCFFPRFCLFDGSCAVGLRAFFLTFFLFFFQDLGLMKFLYAFFRPMWLFGAFPFVFCRGFAWVSFPCLVSLMAAVELVYIRFFAVFFLFLFFFCFL